MSTRSKTPQSEAAVDIVIRRGEAGDAEGIEKLVSPDVLNTFGRVNVLKIM